MGEQVAGKAVRADVTDSGSVTAGIRAATISIAPTAIFLAASDSDHISGQVIPIEGGMILV